MQWHPLWFPTATPSGPNYTGTETILISGFGVGPATGPQSVRIQSCGVWQALTPSQLSHFCCPPRILPTCILTYFRFPFVTSKLQPAGLLLTVSADAKERPVGNKNITMLRVAIKLQPSKQSPPRHWLLAVELNENWLGPSSRHSSRKPNI